MGLDFTHIQTGRACSRRNFSASDDQIKSLALSILGSAPMEGALNITLEAGIERIREVSLSLTAFLSGSLETRLISR